MKQETKTIYDKGAEKYEEVMRRYWHVPKKPFIESLDFKPGDKILSAVVGTGLDLPHFPQGTYVTGIDASKEMLNQARKKHSKAWIELKEMDLHSLNFPDNYFDAAILTFTLCVLKDPVKAIQEIVRVTKPNSKIAILDYCKSRNPETEKWQELFNYHAENIGFPKDIIAWDSLMDYDNLIYDSGLPLEIKSDFRIESENPFSTACQIILINKK
ncbi:methyltransferase type 11 [Candidatus Pacearchaeota archaeon RBG_13_36_9]|nr:MAG: methyltransferase type 11 [Candidatus Pacearchaeota archaeon RBG_13_36_9]HJX50935.1 class I SAM-dependent methyltransferase [Candidatus Nanoarchaeia archaeon]